MRPIEGEAENRKIFKNFRFWLGGAVPQTLRILAGGAKDTPLDGFSRGAAAPRTPRVFFSASDDTGAVRPNARPDVSRLKRKPEKYIEKYFEPSLDFSI